MLSPSHFIAFNTAIKSKHFLNALKNLSLHVISYIRQANDQDLFKIDVSHARKFCKRPSSERKSWSKVASRLRLNVCWCTLEVCKYKKRNHNGDHEDFLLKCHIGCKNVWCRSCTYSSEIFTSAFARNFTSKR